MKKYLLVFLLIIGIVSLQSSSEPDLPKSALKKVNKTLGELWPDANIEYNKIDLSGPVEKALNSNLKRLNLYQLSQDDVVKGYMFLSAAPSRYDYFDLMVIYNPDLSIASSDVLIYREAYGGEIGSNRWLKQFTGLTYEDDIKLDYDIQGISGATISVRSATNAVRRLTDTMKQLQEMGRL